VCLTHLCFDLCISLPTVLCLLYQQDLPEGFTTNAGGSGVLAASAVTANPLGAFEEEDDDDDVVEKEKEESAKDEDASQAAASPPSETA